MGNSIYDIIMKVLFCAPVAYFILFSILGYFSYNKKRIVVNFINKKNNEVTSVKIGYYFAI